MSLALNSDSNWRPFTIEGYIFVALHPLGGKAGRWASCRKKAEEKAMIQLNRVRIAAQAQKHPLQLSGGQQQRRDCARPVPQAQNHVV